MNLMRRRTILTLLAVFMAGAIAERLPQWRTARVSARNVRRPLTAVETGVYYAPNGQEILRETRLYGIRSDGSTALETRKTFVTDPSRPWSKTVRKILDLGRGKEWLVLAASRSVSTLEIDPRLATRLRAAPPNSCEQPGWTLIKNDAAPEPGMYLGHKVIHLVEEKHLPDRTLTRQRWAAPALDCFALRTEESIQLRNGASAGRSVHQVESVQPGEPSAAMFDVDPSFIERSPSEALAAEAEIGGIFCTECQKQSTASFDENYRRRHRQ